MFYFVSFVYLSSVPFLSAIQEAFGFISHGLLHTFSFVYMHLLATNHIVLSHYTDVRFILLQMTGRVIYDDSVSPVCSSSLLHMLCIIMPSYIYPFSSSGHLGYFQVFAVTLRDSVNIQEYDSLKSLAPAKPFHILLLSHHFSPIFTPE